MTAILTPQAPTTTRPLFDPFTVAPSTRGTFRDIAHPAAAPYIDTMFEAQLGQHIVGAREWFGPNAALFVVEYPGGLFGAILWHGMADGFPLVDDALNTSLYMTAAQAHRALFTTFEVLHPGEVMWSDSGEAAPIPF